jgi:hypothetical protein
LGAEEACQKPLAYAPQALATLLDEVRASHAAGEKPVVVFDLDGTLFSSVERNLVVLEDFLDMQPLEIQRAYHESADNRLVRKYMSQTHEPLTVEGILKAAIGPDLAQGFLLDYFKRYWVENYISSRHIHVDQPLAQSAEYVKKVSEAGALIVFLTARTADRMLEGTLRQLASAGFDLTPEKGRLLIKPNGSISSVDFKLSAQAELKGLGKVLALFDNEPENLRGFDLQFPDAKLFYLETGHTSPDASIPARSLWLQNYIF